MPISPSIFNDVIGPVMRGPSSSHTAASWRIARMSMSLIPGKLKKAYIEFDKNGAWASNYREQGTALGMDGGLLGIDMTDDRMKNTAAIAKAESVEIEYAIGSFENSHPNTVRLRLFDKEGNKAFITGVSLGGGSFVLTMINGFSVHLNGDSYELLLFAKDEKPLHKVQRLLGKEVTFKVHKKEDGCLMVVHAALPFGHSLLSKIQSVSGLSKVYELQPVMPIVPQPRFKWSFKELEELLEFADDNKLDAGDLGLHYEQKLCGLNKSVLQGKMTYLVQIMEHSIAIGLKGTMWRDRILPQQSHLIKETENKGKIIANELISDIIANVTAIMEAKSAMEVIVANPTAGSCGTVAGVLKAVSDKLNSSPNQVMKAYFASGIVGVYFAKGPGFAAEEHGCQVECGASAGMAAAAIVQLYGGSARQAFNAASLAIQNMIGLVCDPVADRVEVPCLGKNVSAAVNAYSSAIMVLAGYQIIIPYDQVLETVKRVGNMMPSCHKCTGTGGLAITPAARDLKNSLEKLQLLDE